MTLLTLLKILKEKLLSIEGNGIKEGRSRKFRGRSSKFQIEFDRKGGIKGE